MADVIRFLISDQLGSSIMRGEQLAAMLKHVGYDSECILLDGDNHKALKDTICIVVKSCEPAILDELKHSGNKIIYDIVDKLARKESPHETMGLIFADGVIATHKLVADYFMPMFPNAKIAIIPHQYDPRFEVKTAEHKYGGYPYKFRLGYFGASFNHHFKEISDVVPIYDTRIGFEYGGFFTCHYNVRDTEGIDSLFKPAMKVATAAACGSCIITSRDPAAVELLGPDYPFYVDKFDRESVGATIKKAYLNFDKEMWWDAMDLMAMVKNATSIEVIAEHYITYLGQFGLDKKPIPDLEKRRAKANDVEIMGVEV